MRITILGLAALLAGSALAQTTSLTIEEALRLARKQNGSVRAAVLTYRSTQAQARAAYASFLPTLTPTYTRQNFRDQYYTGYSTGVFQGNGDTADLVASYRIFDSGSRQATYRQSALARDAQELTSLSTIRSVLVDAYSKFYNSLRTQELLKVQADQLERVTKTLDSVVTRIDTGDLAKVERWQAEADVLNAKVSWLTAKNSLATAQANLKAVIGWSPSKPLPSLEAPKLEVPAQATFTLDEAIKTGLDARPDLKASQKQIDSQKLSVKLAKIDSSISYTLVAQHDRSFGPAPVVQSLLIFKASVPLYDGRRSSENVRAADLTLKSLQASQEQSVLDATSEIESDYLSFTQNRERFDAAQAALKAAQANFDAAQERFNNKVATILDVITAQVSLTTAQTNMVEALYDTLISEVSLKLAMGQQVPGEKELEHEE